MRHLLITILYDCIRNKHFVLIYQLLYQYYVSYRVGLISMIERKHENAKIHKLKVIKYVSIVVFCNYDKYL